MMRIRRVGDGLRVGAMLVLCLGAARQAWAQEEGAGPSSTDEEYAGIRCDHLLGYKSDQFRGKISGTDTAGTSVAANINADIPNYFIFVGCDGRWFSYDLFLSAGQSSGTITGSSGDQTGTTTLLENVMDFNATVLSRRWLKFELGVSLENYLNGSFRIQNRSNFNNREELLITSALGPDLKIRYFPIDEIGVELWAAYNFINLFSTHVRGIQDNSGGGSNPVVSTQEYNIGDPKFLSAEFDFDFIPLDWLGFTVGVGNTNIALQEIPKGSSTALSNYAVNDFYWLIGVNLLY